MRALLVIKGNPVSDHPRGVRLALKAMSVHTLLLQRSNDAFHHSVLLRAVWRDELLLHIATHQPRVVATGEHQAVVRAQQEGHLHLPQRAVAGNQGLFVRGRCGAGLAGSLQVPAKQLPRAAIDHQRQAQPAVRRSRPGTGQSPNADLGLRRGIPWLRFAGAAQAGVCGPVSP